MSNGWQEQVTVFRLDPTQNQFRVLYAPTQPQYISAWDRNARLVFNAGFFDEANAALGLLVADSQIFGQSYAGYGGMLQVADGLARVRWLVDEPYQPGEALEQAVQGFPMLLRPDGTRYADTGDAPARRTVVGQDTEGRILLLIVPRETFTLAALAEWLTTTNLGLTLALNLDGGGSTGYYAGPNDMTASQVRLPAVVAVYPP
jgi:exopolysaccharide biosynthesis protein